MLKIMLLSFLISTLLGSTPAFAGGKYALVIGNSNYKNPLMNLRNASNDAEAIKDSLVKIGYNVTLLNDVSLSELKSAVHSYLLNLMSDDVFVFHYSGHAIQMNGTNFLQTIDVDSDVNGSEVPERFFSLDYLFANLETKKSKNIIILDACRNNPFSSTNEVREMGLAKMFPPENTYLAYSTSPGKTASDGIKKFSPFSGALKDLLPTNGLTIDQVFNRVKGIVRTETSGGQTPWTESSFYEDFCFTRCRIGSGGINNAPKKPPGKTEAILHALKSTNEMYIDLMASNLSDFALRFKFPIPNFFGDKNITREQFLKDKRKYFNHWSSRYGKLKKLEVISFNEDLKRIVVKLEYDFFFVNKKGKPVTGSSKNEITHTWIDEKYQITHAVEEVRQDPN